MKKLLLLLIIIALTSINIFSQAIPKQIDYQGVLKDASGNLLTGDYALTFKIYNEATGGTPLWTEIQVIAVANGLFSAHLGSTTPITTVPFDRLHFLGITLGTEPELLPRTMLTPSPYSFMTMNVMDNTITTVKIVDATITGTDIANNTIGPEKLNFPTGNGTIGGGGTATYLPIFTNGNTLGNSKLFQDGNGDVQVGNDGVRTQLTLSANDNINEGGQINWNGGGNYDDWYQDLALHNMRIRSNSANNNFVEIFNNSTGTSGLYVEGNVGIGTPTPATKLHILGTSPIFRLADGTQATGKILVSDANGNASWQDNSNYRLSVLMNNASISANTSWQKMGDYLTFSKNSSNSTIEVYFNSNVRGGTFNSSNGVQFELRMDGVASTIHNQGVIQFSSQDQFISMIAIYTGLAAGSHTVSVWTRTFSGTTTGTLLDPGGCGGRILVKETF